jgi:ubiquinone/menaquinone biosynthesis C-methylase UbiE
MKTFECCCGGNEMKLDEKSQTIKDFYNSAAEGTGLYNKDVDKFSPDGPTEKIIEILKGSDKTKILDLGCGMGTTLLRIVNEYNNADLYMGLDFSENMVEHAKNTAKSLPGKDKNKVWFFVANISDLPYLDGQFDFIYCECVLNLVIDRKKVMNEIQRVLAPGGIFVYTDFIAYKPVPAEIRDDLSVISGCRAGSITMDENIKLMEDNLFENILKFDYSFEKKRRYRELLKDNSEAQEVVNKFEKEKPFSSDFLETEIGYYVVSGIKKA